MEYIEVISLDADDRAIGIELKVYPVKKTVSGMPCIITGLPKTPYWMLVNKQVRKYNLGNKLEALME